jgi:hypothetical protein
VAADLRVQRMPSDGLWRAGRWADVDRFPPPARSIHSVVLSPGPPLLDGYRWEDAFGRFSTAKFSASGEAAVGRTIARYRRRVVNGVSILDKIKGFLTADPDNPTEPTLRENIIPASYFEDAYLLHLEFNPQLQFIDIEHQRTRDALKTVLISQLASMGQKIDAGLSQCDDRRLTRLVTATLHDICDSPPYDEIAGFRYRAPDRHWDAYVFWDSPARIDLTQERSVEPIFPDSPELQAAMATLDLSLTVEP